MSAVVVGRWFGLESVNQDSGTRHIPKPCMSLFVKGRQRKPHNILSDVVDILRVNEHTARTAHSLVAAFAHQPPGLFMLVQPFLAANSGLEHSFLPHEDDQLEPLKMEPLLKPEVYPEP